MPASALVVIISICNKCKLKFEYISNKNTGKFIYSPIILHLKYYVCGKNGLAKSSQKYESYVNVCIM